MAGALDVVIRFIGDSSKLKGDIDSASGAFDKFKKMAVGVGAAVAGGFAIKEVVDFGKASVGAALESEKATSRLEQVFKSMGDTTGKAAKAAEDYAGKLSKKIGVDDEQIMQSQALLATFREVGSETGRNAGIFDRATQASADLAATGYGSMDSAAKMLGKALNDPIKGLTALSKAGVGFTQQQKDSIKTMVEHGDVLGAQNIIMSEVEKQVGGVAEATATSSDKMGVAFGELQEGIGKAILPIIDAVLPMLTAAFEWAQPIIESAITKVREVAQSLVDWFVAHWPQIRDTVVEVFNNIASVVGPILQRVAGFVTGTLVPAFSKIWESIQKAAPGIGNIFQTIGDIAQRVFPVIATVIEKITPVLATVIGKVIEFVGWMGKNLDIVVAIAAPFAAYVATTKIMSTVQSAVTSATKAWSAAQWLLNAAMTANPVGLIVAAIVALIAIIVILYLKFDVVRNAIDALWQFMQVAWDAILAIIKGVWDWISQNWPLLLAILTGPIGVVVTIIVKNFDTIKNAVMTAWNWVKDNWPLLLEILTGPIGIAVGQIIKHWDTIKNGVKAVWEWIKSTWSGLTEVLTAPFRTAADLIRRAIDGVKSTVQGAWDFISGIVKSIFDAVTGLPGRIGDIGARIAEIIKRPINAIIRAINGIKIEIPKVDIPFDGSIGGGSIGFPHIPELAKGGYVSSSGLAMVHRGEAFSGTQNQMGFGTTINLNVSVAPGTDPAQTGRAVVDLIRAYERANGRKVLAS